MRTQETAIREKAARDEGFIKGFDIGRLQGQKEGMRIMADTEDLEQQEFNHSADRLVELAFKAGEEQGIRKVVDWLNKEMHSMGRSRQHYINKDRWQTQVKDWLEECIKEKDA